MEAPVDKLYANRRICSISCLIGGSRFPEVDTLDYFHFHSRDFFVS